MARARATRLNQPLKSSRARTPHSNPGIVCWSLDQTAKSPFSMDSIGTPHDYGFFKALGPGRGERRFRGVKGFLRLIVIFLT